MNFSLYFRVTWLCCITLCSLEVASQDVRFGIDSRIPLEGIHIQGSPDPLPELKTEEVFSNLRGGRRPSFTRPILIKPLGESKTHLVVVEQGGNVYIIENQKDIEESTIFLDLRRIVSRQGNEEGLLGLAFHPEYESNGFIYVYYSDSSPRRSVISRFQRSSDDPFLINPDSESIIMEIPQPAGNHNGGTLEFGPDGFLYIALGDGGGSNDQFQHGQNLNSILGTIIRIDVNVDEGYEIPSDNPFVGIDGEDEIWAYGLRNPWRIAFDTLTGDLWAADVGQNQWEEVNLIVKGGNYGWNILEGTNDFRTRGVDQDTLDTLIPPIIEYNHSVGQSITGGVVYRGSKIPTLTGAYVYADFITRLVWAVRYDGEKVIEHKQLFRSPAQVASFGVDAEGEIFICGFNGRIYSISHNDEIPPTVQFPTRLSETGLFTTLEDLTPNPGLISYSVNSPLWSDHAGKDRWMAIPNNQQITFTEKGAWVFPNDTFFVKHFSLNLERGNPKTNHRLETRLLIKTNDEWNGYTYIWNDEQSEAILLDNAAEKTFTVFDPVTNETQQQTWYYPSRNDCLKCHTEAAGFVLGLQTPQMNKMHQYETVEADQLATLNHIELFTENVSQPLVPYEKFSSLQDTSATLTQRASSYIDANCAFCHIPGGSGNASIDLRFDRLLDDNNVLETDPSQGDLGIVNAKILAINDPERSLLLERIIRLDHSRMPPLASSIVDKEAEAVIREWINNLNSNVADWKLH